MSPTMTMSGPTAGNVDCLYQKGVKNMYDNGINHVPASYILPLSDRPNQTSGKNACPDLNLKLPVIDFAELQGPNRPQVLRSLAHACENYGFFQLVNHDIPEEVVSDMVKASRRFFEMPLSEREKYMSADVSSPVRYGTSFNQMNDAVLCWRDFLKLACHPMQDVLPHWPSSPSDFRGFAVQYAKTTRLLFMVMVHAMVESLGINDLDDEIFKELENGSQLMVVNCFPPCPQPDLTLGMPPHSDYGFLTLLLQDRVKGLQIQHEHDWVTVEPVPGSFVVNVGDHLEIFSNGRYKSAMHRVLVNSMNHRISVASLHSFPFSSIVRPSEKLVTEARPRLYKDTDFATFLDYIKSRDSMKKNFLESRKVYN